MGVADPSLVSDLKALFNIDRIYNFETVWGSEAVKDPEIVRDPETVRNKQLRMVPVQEVFVRLYVTSKLKAHETSLCILPILRHVSKSYL